MSGDFLTKQDIKVRLEHINTFLDLDYHDFVKYCNENMYYGMPVDNDFYTVFTAQRQKAVYEISVILKYI